MLVVFVALGVGMAVPYVCLAWFPGWRRRLPRPGPWLERFKQVLAFPLYATVICRLAGACVTTTRLRLLPCCSASLRLGGRIVHRGARPWARRIHRACGAATSRTLSPPTPLAPAVGRQRSREREREWTAFTPADHAAPTVSGRLVFVDSPRHGACQAYKRLVLNADERGLPRRGVALVRADSTRRDPAITQALAALGRNGVLPMLHRPGKEPLLLPRSAAARCKRWHALTGESTACIPPPLESISQCD
jgi:thiol:disulfide interchange protein DsbD